MTMGKGQVQPGLVNRRGRAQDKDTPQKIPGEMVSLGEASGLPWGPGKVLGCTGQKKKELAVCLS